MYARSEINNGDILWEPTGLCSGTVYNAPLYGAVTYTCPTHFMGDSDASKTTPFSINQTVIFTWLELPEITVTNGFDKWIKKGVVLWSGGLLQL